MNNCLLTADCEVAVSYAEFVALSAKACVVFLSPTDSWSIQWDRLLFSCFDHTTSRMLIDFISAGGYPSDDFSARYRSNAFMYDKAVNAINFVVA